MKESHSGCLVSIRVRELHLFRYWWGLSFCYNVLGAIWWIVNFLFLSLFLCVGECHLLAFYFRQFWLQEYEALMGLIFWASLWCFDWCNLFYISGLGSGFCLEGVCISRKRADLWRNKRVCKVTFFFFLFVYFFLDLRIL